MLKELSIVSTSMAGRAVEWKRSFLQRLVRQLEVDEASAIR
jgi:hypothetical protein